MWFPVIYLLACISCILADAPGDQELTCLNPNLVTPEDRNFPDNWIVLLDTYDYTTLYPFVGGVGSVWVNKDFDGDYDSVSKQIVASYEISCMHTVRGLEECHGFCTCMGP